LRRVPFLFVWLHFLELLSVRAMNELLENKQFRLLKHYL